MAVPPLKDADPITGDEVFIGVQGGRLKRFAIGLLRGIKGDTGPKGDAGPSGPQGPAGPTGSQGPAGPIGQTGPQGPQGLTGAAGPTGPKGDAGLAGKDGAAGPAGATGPKGDTGPQGAQGVKGDAGPSGPIGATGAAGPAGATGPKGDTGPQGIQGPKGDTGATGATGPQGAAGTPKRVERFTALTNASGIASFTFSPAFSAAPDVDVIEGWVNGQMVTGALTASATTTGCSVQVMVSQGTLIVGTAPFTKAGANVSVTVRAIGT